MSKLLSNNNKANLFFFGTISLPILAQELLGKVGIVLPIPGLLILALITFIASRFNKVSFTEEKKFLNHKGEFINKYPNKFFKVIVFSFVSTVILIMTLERYTIALLDILPITFFWSMLTLFIVSYFIYIDCPITILFNKNAWEKEITGFDRNAKSTYNPALHMSNNSDLFKQKSGAQKFAEINSITDLSYRHLSSNIHNSNKYK